MNTETEQADGIQIDGHIHEGSEDDVMRDMPPMVQGALTALNHAAKLAYHLADVSVFQLIIAPSNKPGVARMLTFSSCCECEPCVERANRMSKMFIEQTGIITAEMRDAIVNSHDEANEEKPE